MSVGARSQPAPPDMTPVGPSSKPKGGQRKNQEEEKERIRFLGLIPVDWRFELTRYHLVRAILRSRWSTFLLTLVNLVVFMVILLAGVIGNPLGNANFGIMIVWIVWWSVLILFLIPFASRLWCGVCPLPAFGEWLARLSIIRTTRDDCLTKARSWPRPLRNMWLVNFVFLGVAVFSGIITTRPLATTVMLGSIIVVSVVMHLIYERRTFCRYLCPVGGFLGLYSNFSAVEIRPKSFVTCQGHRVKECYAGSATGYGCPWLEVPMNLKRNTYCGWCFECFRSCSLDNMAINLRPFGTDLLVDSKRGLDEAWKAFIMLGAAAFYSITMMGPWGWIKDWANLTPWTGIIFFALLFGFTVMLLVPAIHALFAVIAREQAGPGAPPLRKVFTNYSYTLVPLGLAAWVAFSLAIIFPNGSYVIPVLSDPFGWGWDLFGTAGVPWTPVLTGLLPYMQIAVMVAGLIFSIDLAWKLSRQTFDEERAALRAVVPQVVYLSGLTSGFLWLFVG